MLDLCDSHKAAGTFMSYLLPFLRIQTSFPPQGFSFSLCWKWALQIPVENVFVSLNVSSFHPSFLPYFVYYFESIIQWCYICVLYEV